ncbi:MAG: PKD domain-containing protein, partial [Candidatus Woesearchaeota archaeon]
DAGSYVARCSVTDSRGVSASRSRTVTVSEPVVPKDPLGVSLSVSPVSGYAPLTVSYSCSVSGGRDPIDARVRVGSSTSSALSGDITFESSGVYTIVCEATDADGDSASDSKTVSVSAAPKLSASLSADPSEGFAPLTTNYACSASGGIAPYSYSVSFGDGSSSTDRQGSYTYHDSGSYTMTCTVRDAIGQKATRSRTITVDEQPAPLKVSYSVSPSSGDAPLSTQHSCSVSGGVPPYSYRITTGDGRTIGASSASHVYYDAGSYVARCSVTDSRGVSASRSRTVTVFEPEPPVDPLGVSLSVSPVSGYAPLTVSYSCSVSGGRDPVDARVRVGSSATSALSGDITFESPGVYTVVCDATDAENNHASDSVTITVEKPAPEPFSLSLSATPQRGVEPFTTRIACEAHGGYGTVSYMLDPAVGDVIEANAPIDEQVHYSSYGVYDVTCTATDSLDRSVSDTVPVIVIPDSAVSITPQGPTSDDDLSCQVDAYPHGSFDFNWYRNGELVRSDSGVSSSVVKSDETAPGDVYTCVAKMPIVGDEIGRDSVSIDDPAPEPLSMSFSVHPASGEAPLDVLYVCEAFGGKAPFEYVVDIEHTWFSTSIHESEASIRLHQPGTYVFTCTATDDAGSSISEERTVVVTPRDYEGDWSISADPLSGPAPLPVSFTSDTSQIPIVGGVEWDFGDGHRFSGSSRVHTFARKGTYEVTATVRLEDGQVLTRSVTIHVAAREDPIIEVDASRVRITRAFAEVVGDRVYATLTVRNDAGFTVRGMTATMQVPEHGVWRSQPMPEIPHGSSRTISFFVPIDDVSFETFAVFKAENRDVDLARTVIVLR